MVVKSTKLYDPEAYSWFLSSIKRFSTKWCYDFDLWALNLKNNMVFILIMMIKCTKLYGPAAYDSVYILS
jgi:hypothetical protein